MFITAEIIAHFMFSLSFSLKVFGRLSFPVVRESTMVVLSHMLLRFQHSPQAFHEVNHLLNIS